MRQEIDHDKLMKVQEMLTPGLWVLLVLKKLFGLWLKRSLCPSLAIFPCQNLPFKSVNFMNIHAAS